MRHQGPYCVDVAPGLQERRLARHRVHSISIGAMLQEQTHDLLYLWLATDNQEIHQVEAGRRTREVWVEPGGEQQLNWPNAPLAVPQCTDGIRQHIIASPILTLQIWCSSQQAPHRLQVVLPDRFAKLL